MHDRKYKFNSGVFNARDDDYRDSCKAMSEHEISLIKYTLKELYENGKWKKNPTLSLKDMEMNPYYPGDCLPIQNRQ